LETLTRESPWGSRVFRCSEPESRKNNRLRILTSLYLGSGNQ
jgi:hypothetical protein